MKELLEVSLFGCPSIHLEGRRISFPYRQAEAILYYLFFNKSINKYTLADIIWGDKCSEEKINANLRNAFYVIRKALGKDFIEKNSGDKISVNPDIDLVTDTALFLQNPENLSLYKGDFLEDFYLKNNTLFNDWVISTRQLLKNLYLEKLQLAIVTLFDKGDFTACEMLCRIQIQMNEFDETAYKYMMQIYLERKNYTLALNIYNQLEQLFKEELFEKPGKEVQKLAKSIETSLSKEISLILETKKELKASKGQEAVFYGRDSERELLKHIFDSFREGVSLQNVLISGEPGIGKTRLAEYFMENKLTDDRLLLFKTRCYYAEEKYILKPWQNLVRQLFQYLKTPGPAEQNRSLIQSILKLFPFLKEDFSSSSDTDDISTSDYKSIQSILVNALVQFSVKQKIVFFIDDVQWADETSLSLIRDLITSAKSYDVQHMMFLMTSRSNSAGEAVHLFEDISVIHQLEVINLDRFDLQDTVNMALRLLPDYSFTEEMQQQLYHATEGNPFFITEVVHNIRYNGSPDDITPNMRNIIKQRITPIPSEYRQILNLISLFFDGASFDCLSVLSHKEDYELVELLEYLLHQNLLREYFDEDNTFFSITHQKIQEYVYEEMSWTKKRILHHKAGLYYENKLLGSAQDMALYPKLIYHFDKGADQQKYLKYAVKYLYNYLNVTHEFFPIMENNFALFSLDMVKETSDSLAGRTGSIEKLLYTIENTLKDNAETLLQQGSCDEEQLLILSDYLHMTGRHYIRACNYEKGLGYILQLKAMNQAHPSSLQSGELLKANRQLICIYINRYEPEKMKQIIDESMTILQSSALPDLAEETAIWQRLLGLYDIMSGHPQEGTGHLTAAILAFTDSPKKDKHLYNLAAAWSWLGEIERHSKNYALALEYYERALGICTQNVLVSGVSIFYAYEGMAAYDSGNYRLAEEKLLLAINHYDKVNLMWGRSLAYSYYAQILLRAGLYKEALEHLATAHQYAKQLENKYELGIIYRIYGQVKAQMANTQKLRQVFAAELKESLDYYIQTASDLLNSVYSPIDQEILRSLKKNILD